MIYFNDANELTLMEMTGKPAKLRQLDNDRKEVRGEAEQIDYSEPESLLILRNKAYLNQAGLTLKGLQGLDIGPELSERGFQVYANAFSNYKPTTPSMTSFFDIQHHADNSVPSWQNRSSAMVAFFRPSPV